MAFTFNLGGDDIDPEDESMEAHYSSEDVLTSEPNSPVPPTRCYYIGETDSEPESTRSLVGTSETVLRIKLVVALSSNDCFPRASCVRSMS